MNKKKKPWWNVGMTHVERLEGRLRAQQWKERFNKIILAKQHFELMESQESDSQRDKAKKRTGTKNQFTELLEDIFRAEKPESFDELLEILREDSKTVIKVDEVNEKLTYENKSSKPSTVTFKTLQNRFSELKNKKTK